MNGNKGEKMKITSKITSNNQVTIPEGVRRTLRVGPNDTIQWSMGSNDVVTVRRASDDLWKIVSAQEKIYGSVDTPEVDW